MIFVDASAAIAMVAGEPDADLLADRLERDNVRRCSAVSIWETVVGLCRSYTLSIPAANKRVERYLSATKIQFVSIGEIECAYAIEAYAKFGKGRHPAALNMGDCYAYACAKSNEAKLLFKGSDFIETDITPA